jgi:endo-1,4-beta-xylanase
MKNYQFSKKIMCGVLCCTTAFLLMLSSCKSDEAADATPEKKPSSAFGVGQGTDNGYFWSLWTPTGTGANITFPNAPANPGNFKIDYTNVSNVVGGKGWNPGAVRNINYNVGNLQGSYNFIGVYGWVKNPLIEYYVSEKGAIYVGGTTQQVNTVSADGHTYTFYRHQQVNAASIQGTQTFWQYIDNWGGQTFNGNKKITMATHINNWKANGGKGWTASSPTTYDYQVFGLEAYGTNVSGSINATVW